MNYLLALLRAPRVGSRTFKALVDRFGSPGQIFAASSATLATLGLSHETVNWINESGEANVISYRIPSNTDCKTCHRSNNDVIPIGLKVRNLNISVSRNGLMQNQLTYLANQGILSAVDPSQFSVLPNYHNISLTSEQRARSYLEINCAHCHWDKGFASNKKPRFSYEKSLEETNILGLKSKIINKIEAGQMPKLGTTVLDKEGIELIKKYINSL